MVVIKPKCVAKSKRSRSGDKESYTEDFNKFVVLYQMDEVQEYENREVGVYGVQ